MFDAKRETKLATAWIAEYFKNQPHAKGVVIGISGGKDSAVCAALCVDAIGADRVLGVSIPNGTQKDIKDAEAVAEILGIKYRVVHINGAYRSLTAELDYSNGGKVVDEHAKMNILPRLRMTVLYALAADKHYRVCGTGNYSEEFCGYTTRWGDMVSDFNPIQYFTTEEVVAIGDVLEMPKQVIHKAPSDGLCGKTDEDNLGFTYANVNKIIKGKKDEVPQDIRERIMKKRQYNSFKLLPIPVYKPEYIVNGTLRDYLVEPF